MIERVVVHRNRYHDSVRLMRASATLTETAGVADAMVAMGTDLNRRLAIDLGFPEGAVNDAGPNDLLVALRADRPAAIDVALAGLERVLTSVGAPPDAGFVGPPTPRTIGRAADGADVALISVPGSHAFVEAMEALRAGLSVMIFSDNVPVDQEIILKNEAEASGLLVMGPDCGTAVVSGVGLGFSNAVEPGPVGIVGASGTGIQQLCCLLDDDRVGVRHALGTGSNDTSAAVGGRSTLRALEMLDGDPAVEVIVLVSKPPAPSVADRLREAAATASTPVVLALVGDPNSTLEDAAGDVIERLGSRRPVPMAWPAESHHRPGVVRGLFAGGTLRHEAATIAAAELGPIADRIDTGGHAMVDLGADEYTRGRPHPMIDQRIRLDLCEAAIADPRVGVVLADVVLGYGAHPDPAGELADVVGRAVDHDLAVVVSLCGARHDPQGRDRQAEALRAVGASVYLSNAAAARRAVDLTLGGLA